MKRMLVPALAAFLFPVSASAMDIVGRAMDVRSGEVLYLEEYDCVEDGSLCRVDYRDSGGSLIASKEVDYSRSLVAPALTFEDFRSNASIEVAPMDGPELVVDAGFDNYVRERWDELTTGESVRFSFLVAGRDKPLPMRAEETGECAEGEVCLEVGLDAWLIGSLVPPIRLTYERETRRLLRFEGVSNLRDDEGRSRRVDIRYSYAEAPSDPISR